jgi:hypothetical protein
MLSFADLDAEYDEMNKRNRQPVPQNKQGQRCLGVATLGHWTLDSYTWPRFLRWLQPLTAYGTIFTPTPTETQGQLHWTLQQCRPFAKPTPDVANIEFQVLLETLAGTEITYRGIALTPAGIILKGYPRNEHQYQQIVKVRASLPGLFLESDERYEEPYKNTICHSTVFRWSKVPPQEILDYVLTGVNRWSEAKFATLQPHEWIFGYLTLEVKSPDCILYKRYKTPLRICHRGLLAGPNPALENNPAILELNFNYKLTSECDVWFTDDKFFLGHDNPTFAIDWTWIIERKDYLLLHAKTAETFVEMKRRNDAEGLGLDIFYHTDEDIILTTGGKCIVYPGQPVLENCMSMMPEREPDIDRSNAAQICSDFERI